MTQKGFILLPIVIIVAAIVVVGAVYFGRVRPSSTRVEEPIPTTDQPTPTSFTNTVVVPTSQAQPTTPPLRRITVSGYAYEDRSDDGVYNSDDPKLPNMQIYLLDSFNNQQISTVFTNSSGEFSITLNVRGNLIVRPTAYNNFVPKTPEKSVVESSSGLEFRFRSASASVPGQNIGIIEGNVYQDINKNKTRDAGETSVYFYKLYLKDASGNYFNTVENAQATDAGGHFKYVNLPVPGTYTILLSNPTGAYDILQPETAISLTQTTSQNTNIEIPVYKY